VMDTSSLEGFHPWTVRFTNIAWLRIDIFIS
jgi:hypothetical protein